jgi:Fic family protein
MNQTLASNETKLGILNHEELNKHEAKGLKNTWEFLVSHQEEVFDTLLVNQAHKYGFNFLYDWAGKYRITTPLVGNLQLPPPHLITEQMINLFNDLNYKLDNLDKQNLEDLVKLLAWFEHRFIFIHPYTNTNGRMARLLVNYILLKLGYPILDYSNRSENRTSYIKAMQEADHNDFERLEIFIAQELNKSLNQF